MNVGPWRSHLDPALAGGLVGRLATLIRGFGGARLTRITAREATAAPQDQAAVRAVLYELTTIRSEMAVATEGHSFVPAEHLPEWVFLPIFSIRGCLRMWPKRSVSRIPSCRPLRLWV